MWRLLALHVLTSAWALYPPNSSIIELSGSNFNEMVLKSDDLWLVQFFVSWSEECTKLSPELQKAADILKGVVKVGAVDSERDEYLTQKYNIKFMPTFKMFGVNKKKPVDFDGPRTAQGLVDDALAMIPTTTKPKPQPFHSENVVRLTDDNFNNLVIDSPDMWLVVFYAPWCATCKQFSSHWVSAAFQLKGKMKIGALDGTVHRKKPNEYNVKVYPTVKYFRFGKKTRQSAVGYNGGDLLSADIVKWALDKIDVDLPAPEILQMVNEASFINGCQLKPYCVISVLPHILDCKSDCRNTYLGVLKRVGETHKARMWGWMWSQAGDHPDLERALDLGGFGYPALVVVNINTNKYSLMKGSFSYKGINNFLWYLLQGRESFSPLKARGFSNIESVEAWNGKDSESPNWSDSDMQVKYEL